MAALTEKVIDLLTRGYNIEQIAKKLSVPSEEVFTVWQGYVQDRKEMPREEQWILHLMRLEKLLTQAHEMLEVSGEDPKAFDATVGILDRIEQMQNLNLSRIEEAKNSQIQLTRAQVQIMFQVFSVMQEQMKRQLMAAFQRDDLQSIKGEILDDFDSTFAQIQRRAIEEVNNEDS